MTAPTPAERAEAQAFFRGQVTPDTAAARQALLDLYADGYAAGGLATAQQIPGAGLVGNLAGIFGSADPATSWANWEPGNVDAALLLDDGGFAKLLEQADITIKSIGDTTIDRLGSILADGVLNGDSIDSIAGSLNESLNDPDRAYQIADTEVARATSLASQDMYAQNSVAEWDWLLSPDACEVCSDNADGGPYPVGDGPDLPAHPSCRCSSAPRDPGANAVNSPDSEGPDDE